jgi:hypothetical protein
VLKFEDIQVYGSLFSDVRVKCTGSRCTLSEQPLKLKFIFHSWLVNCVVWLLVEISVTLNGVKRQYGTCKMV